MPGADIVIDLSPRPEYFWTIFGLTPFFDSIPGGVLPPPSSTTTREFLGGAAEAEALGRDRRNDAAASAFELRNLR